MRPTLCAEPLTRGWRIGWRFHGAQHGAARQPYLYESVRVCGTDRHSNAHGDADRTDPHSH